MSKKETRVEAVDAESAAQPDISKINGAAVAPASRNPPRVRMIPAEGTQQPVLANHTTLEVTPGLVYIDFGFIEPHAIATLQRVAREGGELPAHVNARVATRVAMSLDALYALHQQVSKAIETTMHTAQQQMGVLQQLMKDLPAKTGEATPAT